jgi:hypothetical protein
MRRCAEGVPHHEKRDVTFVRILKDVIAARFDKLAVGEEDGATVEGFLGETYV